MTLGQSWGGGAAQPGPQQPVVAELGAVTGEGPGGAQAAGAAAEIALCTVSRGFGYIKTSWAKSSLWGGLGPAAVGTS